VFRVAGAGWVSAEWCGDVSARLPWVTLYQPDRAAPQSGGRFDDLAKLIDALKLTADRSCARSRCRRLAWCGRMRRVTNHNHRPT
jgi:hypothetical protein